MFISNESWVQYHNKRCAIIREEVGMLMNNDIALLTKNISGNVKGLDRKVSLKLKLSLFCFYGETCFFNWRI